MSYSDVLSDEGMDPRDRKVIGYTEKKEEFYPLHASQRGFIATASLILCKYCRSSVDHMGGPRYDVVCLDCYEKTQHERVN